MLDVEVRREKSGENVDMKQKKGAMKKKLRRQWQAENPRN